MRTRRQVKESQADEADASSPSDGPSPASKSLKAASAAPKTRSPKKKADPVETTHPESPASSRKPRSQPSRRAAGKNLSPAAESVGRDTEGQSGEPEPAVIPNGPEHEPLASPGPPAGQDSGDDGDAPEEVSLGTAKQAVQEQRKAEDRVRADARKAAKDRSRRRAQQMAEEKQLSRRRKQEAAAQLQEPESQETAAAVEVPTEAGASGVTPEADSDTLPADVIAALEQQARTTEQMEQQSRQQQKQDRMRLKRKRQELTERQDGPFTVKLLDEKPAFTPSSSAVEFMQERLYGHRLKRSADMLRPVRAGGQPVFCPASNFGGRQ